VNPAGLNGSTNVLRALKAPVKRKEEPNFDIPVSGPLT
jgi:hypothetical protein